MCRLPGLLSGIIKTESCKTAAKKLPVKFTDKASGVLRLFYICRPKEKGAEFLSMSVFEHRRREARPPAGSSLKWSTGPFINARPGM